MERVLGAAVALADHSGIESLTMRRLRQEPGDRDPLEERHARSGVRSHEFSSGRATGTPPAA